MADSVGNGFPSHNIQVGHIFHNLAQDTLYQFKGGDPSVSSNWTIVHTDAQPGTSVIEVDNNATVVGTMFSKLNFIPGTSITLNIADNGGGQANITINSSGSGGSGIDPTGTLQFIDDFTFGVLSGTTFGVLQWFPIFIGAGTVADDITVAGHAGVIALATGAVANNSVLLQPTNDNAQRIPTDAGVTIDSFFIAKLSSVANVTVRVGFSDSLDAPTNGFYFEKLNTDSNWFAVTNKSGTKTRTDTGVAAGTGWTKFRVRLASLSSALFNLNGGSDVNNTTNIPVAGTAVGPEVFILTTAAASVTWLLDYVGVQYAGLSRT